MRKGQSTHGYGKTIEFCKEAKRLNLSIAEAAEKYKLSVSAVRCCAIRNGIKLRNDTGRHGWGYVKKAIIEGIEQGLNDRQVAAKYNIKLHSVRRTCQEYQLPLPFDYVKKN